MKSNPLLKEKYKNLEKEYKKAVLKHTKSVENKIVKSGNKKVFYGYVNKRLHTKTNLPPLIDNNGSLILDSKQKADYLNKHFSSIFLKDDGSPTPDLPQHKQNFNSMLKITVTEEDVKTAIFKLKRTVSRTPEGIPTLFITNFSLRESPERNLLKAWG